MSINKTRGVFVSIVTPPPYQAFISIRSSEEAERFILEKRDTECVWHSGYLARVLGRVFHGTACDSVLITQLLHSFYTFKTFRSICTVK